MANLVFVFFIVISFVAYFYYKTKDFRSTLPIRKKWYKAKAGLALGIFVIVFGINTCIVYPSLVGFLIAAVFILIGAVKAYSSYKRVRHEGQYVKEEYELNK
ncbi:YtpI family protein [Ureibacillus chungkukjangi]|uniref:YtpI-like protein n=1 Tax=Ureibacillus chungkukjangi TaxID=1202712 RepID=A0A318TW38_9BACL|nr:YtpI family protein [Ureibacillus chungkukjangi]MCM3387471.1 YtpI family protein [Ureibacillus chungkukjangi]PYF09046.1 YtpI-like protein [Ureibacillus chungkukjangi]